MAGEFEAGDAVDVREAGAAQIGKGIVNYSAGELRSVMGMKSPQIREKLPRATDEAVHRDYFVLAEPAPSRAPRGAEREGCVDFAAMAVATQSVPELCRAAKAAARGSPARLRARRTARCSRVAGALEARTPEILEANARDLEAGRSRLSDALMDRLALSGGPDRGDGPRRARHRRAARSGRRGARRVPAGRTGSVRKVRVPLGVVAVVSEARPNVTIDAAALCLKSGNAILLRGSSSATHSNAVLAAMPSEAAEAGGLPAGALGAGGRRRPRGAGRARDAGGRWST